MTGEELAVSLDAEPRVYELGYLLSPLIRAEDVAGAVEKEFKSLITSRGGQVGVAGEPVLVRLAYSIKKMIDNKNQTFKEAYFGFMRFSLAPAEAVNLRESLKLSPLVVRSLIIVAPDQSLSPQVVTTAVETTDEVPPVEEVKSTEEVIDKEIDDLLHVSK